MDGSSQINSHAHRGIWFILEQRGIHWKLAANTEKLCEPQDLEISAYYYIFTRVCSTYFNSITIK